MRTALIFGDQEVAFLRELVRRKAPFMVVGLSAAALQGAPVVTQDIDLWFKDLSHPGVKAALKKVDGVYVPQIYQNPPMFAGRAMNLFDIVMTMSGLEDFDEEYRNAVKIPLGRIKIAVLPLDRIIVSKTAAGRDKDRLTLRVLKNAWLAVSSGAHA